MIQKSLVYTDSVFTVSWKPARLHKANVFPPLIVTQELLSSSDDMHSPSLTSTPLFRNIQSFPREARRCWCSACYTVPLCQYFVSRHHLFDLIRMERIKVRQQKFKRGKEKMLSLAQQSGEGQTIIQPEEDDDDDGMTKPARCRRTMISSISQGNWAWF